MSASNGTSNGVAGALHATFPEEMSISAFTGISWYNVLELNVVIWLTFKKRRGLYFYSLLAASWGIVFHQLGYIMRFFGVWKNHYVSEAVVNLGWYCMVTGQSFVLYSRLHLVVRDNRKIKWVLYMIIIDFFIFHVPTSTLDFLCIYNAKKHIPAFNIQEKIQVTGFFIQETIISGLYIFETRKLLKPSEVFQKGQIRRVMRHLIYINLFVIALDLIVLITEYAGLFDIQVTFKGAVYSVKLRVEFAILNELMRLASGGARPKSAYWLSTSGNETERTGGGEVALGTLDSTAGRGDGGVSNNAGRGGLGYSYSAGRGAPTQFPNTADNDKVYVVKTTEVVVNPSNRGLPQQHRGRDEIGDGRFGDDGKTGRRREAKESHKVSPASSEVEFAGRGF
ncbi:MAG: hypothetical protein M1839_004533 [Geoglossum umbratile]|nr:MAG: hypothetical protein M1839_004533 [Geoglossum umbratile]